MTLPTVGSSYNTYGTELNAHINVSHDSDGKIKDGAEQTTSAAPTTDVMIANKKYVDDQIAAIQDADGDDYTVNDSESNAMLKSHAYLTQTSGFVSAIIINTINTIQAYVGTTNDPAGAGTLVQQQGANIAYGDASVQFFVANGKYFEIASGSTPIILWTPLAVSGAAPVDQD